MELDEVRVHWRALVLPCNEFNENAVFLTKSVLNQMFKRTLKNETSMVYVP